MKKRIVHIICKEKFTNGYISFFRLKMTEYYHVFYVVDNNSGYELSQDENIHLVSSYQEILSINNKEVLCNAHKIIISGLFELDRFLFDLSLVHGVLRKTYFQFWGGDFYCFADVHRSFHIRQIVKRAVRKHSYKNAAGLIFLINGEYEKFVDILGITNKHFVAPMPGNPQDRKWFELIDRVEEHNELRILLGNSMDPSNCHEEAFNTLAKYKDENIKIYCPLSYPSGYESYRDDIIKKGHQVFGDKFIPLVDYQPYDDYRLFLASIDIGVYANNRQQAMGNINGLIQLGKKVFIKSNTSMWKSYRDDKYALFDFEWISSLSFSDFAYMDEKTREANINLGKQNDSVQEAKTAWSKILNDGDE